MLANQERIAGGCCIDKGDLCSSPAPIAWVGRPAPIAWVRRPGVGRPAPIAWGRVAWGREASSDCLG